MANIYDGWVMHIKHFTYVVKWSMGWACIQNILSTTAAQKCGSKSEQ
jgi:hypothetical protein